MARTRNTKTLSFAHYNKSTEVQTREVFSLNHDVITGPPIFSDITVRVFRVLAYDAGYSFFSGPTGWIAIKKELILPKTYTAISTTATGEVAEKFNVEMVQFDVDRFGPLAVLTTAEVLPEEHLDGWFGNSATLLSHSLDDGESAIVCFGENVRPKGKVEGDVFAVEFNLKLQPVEK